MSEADPRPGNELPTSPSPQGEREFPAAGFSMNRVWKWGLAVLSAGGLAAGLAALDGAPQEAWGRGWLAYFLLLVLSIISLQLAARLFFASPQAMRLAWLAGILRLGLGVGLMLALPVFGYSSSEVTEAGYFYRDTFTRDQMAWQIVSQDLPILDAFTGIYPGDQYGGILAMSAGIYKVLSPAVHRPFLVLILTSMASGWGVLAVWAAARLLGTAKDQNSNSSRAPILAAAVIAFFPEGVVLGATHMREAFAIPAMAVALCGTLMQISSGSYKKGLGLVVSGLGVTMFFQPPLALAGVLSLEGLYLIHEFTRRGRVDWRKVLLITLVGFVLLGIVTAAWGRLSLGDGQSPLAVLGDWLFFNLRKETIRGGSEQVRELLAGAPLALQSLVMSVYGLLQPLLPAAFFGEGIAFWRLSGSLRAVGWYILAPLALYALWRSFTSKLDEDTLTLRWLSLWTWVWSWFSALRAGGDQWDNPRYRAVFLGMQALLAGWVLARHSGAAGLRRIIFLESSMVVVFSIWYLGRYHYPELIAGFSFFEALIFSVLLGVALVILDWLLPKFFSRAS